MTDSKIAVIGTGVVGLAVAHALLGRGHHVTICGPQPGLIAGQASGAAGAMLSIFSEVDATQPGERVVLEVTQRLRAFARYPAWLASITEASGDVVPLLDGTWVVARDHERDSVHAIAAAATSHGHIAELHTDPECTGLRPDTRPAVGLWLPSEPSLDITRLLAALGTAVGGHRNARWRKLAVRLETSGRAVRILCIDGTEVACDQVVLAAGTGIPALVGDRMAEFGVPPILAGRGVSMVLDTALPVEHTIRTPNSAFACGTHLVPREPGRVYLGATNRLTLSPKASPTPALDEIGVLIGEATRLIDHRFNAAEVLATQVGYRPYTLDHLPLVGPTADPRVLLATATYRCGVLLAPLLAELIVDVIHDPTALDVHPYRANRPMPRPQLVDVITPALVDGLVDHLTGTQHPLSRAARAQLSAVLAAALPAMAGSTALSRLFETAPVPEVMPSLVALAARLENQPCRSTPIPQPRSSKPPVRSSPFIPNDR